MADNVNFVNPDQETTEKVNAPSSNPELEYLKQINQNLEDLIKNVKGTSQSSARDTMPRRDDFRRKQRTSYGYGYRQAVSNATDQFTDAFEKALFEGIVGSDFKKKLQKQLSDLADQVGLELEDIPSAVGDALGREVLKAFSKSKLGKSVFDSFNKWKDETIGNFTSVFTQGVNSYYARHGYTPEQGRAASKAAADAAKSSAGDFAKDVASNAAGDAVSKAATSAAAKKAASSAASSALVPAAGAGVSGGGAALSGLSGLVASAGPALLIIAAVAAGLWALSPAIEGVKNMFDQLNKAGNRFENSREQYIELANKRIAADIETIISEPFEILKAAAQEVYEAWDKNVRLINQTQGYNKEDLQTLMGQYANRLREEGLSSVVSATDITQSLATVLQSGLSGAAAEEFAYIATILNAAIPTQDFFQYADTYSSLAATAMKNGMSQSAAIDYANQQLELFASDVLYASRQLSGGFTTGLKDAGSIFENAVEISQAARTNNPSQIAGVMTAVAAITGSIAPDLASAMTDAITQAATGGNSSQLVALRSLAGINASNTEFLRALTQDPQGVFEELFRNLAEMQNMSNDAYMEVAEGLSDIFGISMDAFARVDFNYLADAIAQMDVSNASLAENLGLLASGESTTSAEQLRMQQINEYLIDEGLSYVMDNEVARAIQEHMWDEQLNQELIEATYAVELKGEALKFMNSLQLSVGRIFKILNPVRAVTNYFENILNTNEEMLAQQEDLKQILELGKVGSGNAQDFYNLTTQGVDLDLTDSYVKLLGGVSQYEAAHDKTVQDYINSWKNPYGLMLPGGTILNSILNGLYGDRISDYMAGWLSSSTVENKLSGAGRFVSKYGWGTVGKSASTFLQSSAGAGAGRTQVLSGSTVSNVSASDAALDSLRAKVDNMLSEDYLREAVAQGWSYEDWAKSNSAIKDMSAALEELGYQEENVKARFMDAQVEATNAETVARLQKQDNFIDEMLTKTDTMIELVTHTNEFLNGIYKVEQDFFDEWVDYFVNHTAYNEAFTTRDEVTKIQNQEKSGTEDAIYALAEALQSNSIDLLRDPTLQTNALLGQILIVVNAIMQQNNTTSGGLSLPDTLQGLSMGLVKSE